MQARRSVQSVRGSLALTLFWMFCLCSLQWQDSHAMHYVGARPIAVPDHAW